MDDFVCKGFVSPAWTDRRTDEWKYSKPPWHGINWTYSGKKLLSQFYISRFCIFTAVQLAIAVGHLETTKTSLIVLVLHTTSSFQQSICLNLVFSPMFHTSMLSLWEKKYFSSNLATRQRRVIGAIYTWPWRGQGSMSWLSYESSPVSIQPPRRVEVVSTKLEWGKSWQTDRRHSWKHNTPWRGDKYAPRNDTKYYFTHCMTLRMYVLSPASLWLHQC